MARKPNWEIMLNVDGRGVMTMRTHEEHAKRVAAAFGLKLEGDYIAHWPLVIQKIGAKVALEQDALSQVLSPKLAVPEGESMIVMVGRVRGLKDGSPSESDDSWLNLDQAIKKIYEATEGKGNMEWQVAVAEPGTLFTKPSDS